MKRIATWILLAALFLTGLSFPVGSMAEDEHPITLTITCDPTPELEGEGTIPDLLFTIRNTGSKDYTLHGAKLLGGYEDDEKDIGGDSFTVLAGSSKEFHLTDVPVREDQLDCEIVYRLRWNELETQINEETGEATFLTYPRETTASIMLEHFVIPELTVTASCAESYVRTDEPFVVSYTISNDTAFDITGIRLYDPEQSMQTILLPSGELLSGESMTVEAEYKMGSEDMTFRPCIEYLSRRREMKTTAVDLLTVGNVSVDLLVETELRSATIKGTVFAVMITNRGNRPVSDIRVFDEINTLIEEPFSLGPDENYTVVCTIQPAVSSDYVRTVRFHVTATDCFGEEIRVDDPGQYQVVPYVEPDSVRIALSAVLQSPYYNEDGKLCASIQFIIRNNGDVKIHNAVLSELTLFGEVKAYGELLTGDTYLMQVYQLDGVNELRFQVTAFDPAGDACSSDVVRLDLSGLRELADRKDDAVLVYTQNEYMQDIDTKYTGVMRTATVIGLSVAALCAIICIILYAVEIRIRSKLPGEFEDEMERVLRSTKRRTPKQLFTDAPTEQFGYVAPIKLRNYGELTEEEAKARRELYAKRLEENMRGETGKPGIRQQTPVRRAEDDGTRVIPVVRRTSPEPSHPSDPKPEGTQVIPAVRRTAPESSHPSEPKHEGTQVIPIVRRTATEPSQPSEPKPEGTQVIPVVRRTSPEPSHPSEPKPEGTQVIPVVRPNQVVIPVAQTPVTSASEEESEPIRIFEPRRPHPVSIQEPETDPANVAEDVDLEVPQKPEPEPTAEPETDPANIAGYVDLEVPQQPEPEPTAEPETDPANIADYVDLEVPQQPEPEPTAEPETDPGNISVIEDADPDVPQKAEPEPIAEPETDPANVAEDVDLEVPQQPEPEPTAEPETDPANIAEEVDPDMPQKAEPEPEPSVVPEPDRDNPPDPLCEPPSLTQTEQYVPEPVPTVPGVRRAFEKSVPARRPAVLHTVRRIGR